MASASLSRFASSVASLTVSSSAFFTAAFTAAAWVSSRCFSFIRSVSASSVSVASFSRVIRSVSSALLEDSRSFSTPSRIALSTRSFATCASSSRLCFSASAYAASLEVSECRSIVASRTSRAFAASSASLSRVILSSSALNTSIAVSLPSVSSPARRTFPMPYGSSRRVVPAGCDASASFTTGAAKTSFRRSSSAVLAWCSRSKRACMSSCVALIRVLSSSAALARRCILVNSSCHRATSLDWSSTVSTLHSRLEMPRRCDGVDAVVVAARPSPGTRTPMYSFRRVADRLCVGYTFSPGCTSVKAPAGSRSCARGVKRSSLRPVFGAPEPPVDARDRGAVIRSTPPTTSLGDARRMRWFSRRFPEPARASQWLRRLRDEITPRNFRDASAKC